MNDKCFQKFWLEQFFVVLNSCSKFTVNESVLVDIYLALKIMG